MYVSLVRLWLKENKVRLVGASRSFSCNYTPKAVDIWLALQQASQPTNTPSKGRRVKKNGSRVKKERVEGEKRRFEGEKNRGGAWKKRAG